MRVCDFWLFGYVYLLLFALWVMGSCDFSLFGISEYLCQYDVRYFDQSQSSLYRSPDVGRVTYASNYVLMVFINDFGDS